MARCPERLDMEVIFTEVQASFICLAIHWQVLWMGFALKSFSFPLPPSSPGLHWFIHGPSAQLSSRSLQQDVILHFQSILCKWQINLPRTPLSFSSPGRLSCAIASNLGSLCPAPAYSFGSEHLFSAFSQSSQVLLYASPWTTVFFFPPVLPRSPCLLCPHFPLHHWNSTRSRSKFNPFCLWSVLSDQSLTPFCLQAKHLCHLYGWKGRDSHSA